MGHLCAPTMAGASRAMASAQTSLRRLMRRPMQQPALISAHAQQLAPPRCKTLEALNDRFESCTVEWCIYLGTRIVANRIEVLCRLRLVSSAGD